MNTPINRRDFLGTAAAGLTLTLTLAADPLGLAGEALADAPFSPNVWLTISPDGTITIVSPASELGQGTSTTLAGGDRRRARRRLVEGEVRHRRRAGTTPSTATPAGRTTSTPRRASPPAATSSRCA